MTETVWGFDLGTTSIGFAVVRQDPANKTGKIIKTGVRIFPEGRTEKELEPRNQRRREKRMARRQIRRRRERRVELSRRFHALGMLPRFGTDEWRELMSLDPYELRAAGMTRRLELMEAGRALYHLAQRRGFKSARKTIESVSGDEEETGVVKQGISELRQELGGKTLGQHLFQQEEKRRRYLGRDMVMEEFEGLWDVQGKHHPSVMTQELKEEMKGLIFTQRPIFWRSTTLGTCRLEPESRLCLKSSWLGQQFLMLQELNSLRLQGENDPLPPDEVNLLQEQLLLEGGLTWPQCRKLLKETWQQQGTPLRSKFNFEIGGKKKLQGNAVESLLQKALGTAWAGYPHKEKLRQELPELLWELDYRVVGRGKTEKILIRSDEETQDLRKQLLETLKSGFGLKSTVANQLVTEPLPSGWLSHSLKAVSKLVPHLEKGKLYSEACDAAYPGHREVTGEGLDFLPSNQSHLKEIRNPSVRRALNELRKVVNNLIRTYGKPDRIRVELARDLKRPASKREEYQNRMKQNESARDTAAGKIREMGHVVNKLAIDKWILWKECDERCPYTDEPISASALFQEGRFDIEHILPYSRTLDNGFMNKTLCQREFNLLKGNRIPYEPIVQQYGEGGWKSFAQRIRKSRLPDAKQRRLLTQRLEDVHEDDFSERQFRDTAYIAKEARDFLMKLFIKQEERAMPVESSNGMITAQLRHLWGMNTLLGTSGGKNREDHRHHAVDALVVALVSRAMVKRMSDLSQYWLRGTRHQFPMPWETFRTEAQQSINNIIVSHKVQAKVQGKLHAELVYGKVKLAPAVTGGKYEQFSRRVRLADLSKSQIKAIKNDTLKVAWDSGGRIKTLLQDHLGKHKDFKKELPFMKTKSGGKRVIKSIKLIENMQPSLMAELQSEGRTWASKNENHHMVVFEDGDGKVRFEVVSRFDAMKRHSSKLPVVNRYAPPGYHFKMSLLNRDSLLIQTGDEKEEVYVIQSIWNSGQLVLMKHNESEAVPIRKTVGAHLREGMTKIGIDPIGNRMQKND